MRLTTGRLPTIGYCVNSAAGASHDRNTLPMQERFLPFAKEVTDSDDNALITIADFPKFAREFFGWPEDCL
jgi:hypothetical protein